MLNLFISHSAMDVRIEKKFDKSQQSRKISTGEQMLLAENIVTVTKNLLAKMECDLKA